jgi:hypothetical protein
VIPAEEKVSRGAKLLYKSFSEEGKICLDLEAQSCLRYFFVSIFSRYSLVCKNLSAIIPFPLKGLKLWSK